MALKLGDIVLDRYVLHAKLGEGGFGTVWQGVDRVERRPVAVKALRSSARIDRRRFEREAKVLAQLDHPHILDLYEFTSQDDGTLILVTELLGRETLDEWIHAERPSLEQVLAVGRQLCSALIAAHRLGVVHRDLKPQNILIREDEDGPHVTVLDFGIARLVGREQADITKTGEILGTPGYMSPEQLRGQKVDAATDLYALGLILFLMLEGRPAFSGASALEIGMSQLTDGAPAPTQGPAPLRRLVTQLLSTEPTSRPGALSTAGTLAKLAGEEVDEQVFVESTEPKPRWALIATLGAMLVAAIAMLVLRSEEPTPRVPTRIPTPAAHVAPVPRDPPPQPRAKIDGSLGCLEKESLRPGRHNTIFHPSALQTIDLLHVVPSSYDGETPVPLLLLFHRSGTSAEQVLDESGFEALAEEHGFIVVAPQSGRRPYLPFIKDDHARLDRWLTVAEETLCLDPDRYYLVGLGEGAAANEYLLCGGHRRFAAVVGSGDRLSDAGSCRKDGRDQRIPRLDFVNLYDRLIPETGGSPLRPCEGDANFWSADRHEEFVQEKHGCDAQSVTEEAWPGVRCRSWSCDVAYRVCAVDGGAYWSAQPWQKAITCRGRANDVGRAAIAWDFLSQFELDAAVGGENIPDELNKPP